MRKKFLYIILLYSVTLLLAACSSGPRYHIAVLQCSVGNWRFQLNNELMAAQHLFEEDVEVEILNCFDRSDVQVRQIDSLSMTVAPAPVSIINRHGLPFTSMEVVICPVGVMKRFNSSWS